MNFAINKETILKYDVTGPRYTSYPTAPEWSNEITSPVYAEKLRAFGQTDKTLSLYIHIPFCEQMCYFCACHMLIRKQDDKTGDEYLKYLFKEIELVREAIGQRKKIRQLHWGGGTPTYLSESQIEQLFRKIQEHFELDLSGEVAIEVDPRTINYPKLKKLRNLGFNRISLGVQDFDPDVQESINRIQPFEFVEQVTRHCRELKFQSLNFDLIYGLPHQTPEKFSETIARVIRLRPDRIALYSFAYLPWMKKHQTKFTPEWLPTGDEKLEIFLNARENFLASGYQAIAMDHFALTGDELAQAFNQGTLYRNFMGYTVKPADEFIGLGTSAIGFLENGYFQNKKILSEYYAALANNELPVERGMILSRDDQIRQWVIHSLMCRFEIQKPAFADKFGGAFDEYFKDEKEHIENCIEDHLLTSSGERVLVSDLGKIFIRNVCMGFDWYLRQKNGHKRFSRTV